MVNLYAFRATDPADLKRRGYPVGPKNDLTIAVMAKQTQKVIAAWGAHAKHDRAEAVIRMLHDVDCELLHLGLTKSWQPRHPLYVKRDTAPQRWCDLA